MSRGRELAAVPAAATLAPVDQRVGRMRSLIDHDTLGGEWDAERLLLVPRPGGRLTRVGPCRVAGCERDRPGAGPLCGWHDRQFASSGRASVEEWVAAGEPRLSQRRWLSELVCLVTGDDGTRCSRPGIGVAQLCHAHDQAWADARRAGAGFDDFLAGAEPLPGSSCAGWRCCSSGSPRTPPPTPGATCATNSTACTWSPSPPPALLAELLNRGWTECDCAALADGNLLRVLREAKSYAARAQS